MKNLLIIDDEPLARKALRNKFPSGEWEVFEAESLDEANEILNSKSAIDVAIVDLRLTHTEEEGDETGLRAIRPSLIRRIHESNQALQPNPIVIVLTAYPNISSCKIAMKAGAYDYLDKNDPDVYSKLLKSIDEGLKERGTPEEYDARKWFDEHFNEVVSKYKGKRIAIYNKEIIASADTVEGIHEILKLSFPRIKPFLVYIPKETK